ncbi:hypothetical protein [Nonomuraea africana]|uniref:hypothetical protein n=1 Tax=Nonomuraea africana TaxID=46171 RepID=UPI0033C39B0E
MIVDDCLDGVELDRVDGGEVGEAEAEPAGVHERAVLAGVIAEGASQHGVQDVCG